ncbi:MAG: DUF4271 domain-containing protein [Tannerellaceae bacterium]|nr:DUF4271 domain-containing protein [Tannerellaceae bacterium]
MFEGYVGIRLWDGQLVEDVIFSLLLVLIMMFAFVFRANQRLFIKMLKDAVAVKERQSLFEETVSGNNEFYFRCFMVFQSLFLCSIIFFSVGRIRRYITHLDEKVVLIATTAIFIDLFLFYQFKRLCYYLLATIFIDRNQYKLWKTNYNAVIGVWGITLYLPALWFVFVSGYMNMPVILFFILYFLCRFVIIYKSIRIFHSKSVGFLYLSLYLCAQEILPLILLYKGIVYLYNFIETSTIWY